jgi:hypothetical protein
MKANPTPRTPILNRLRPRRAIPIVDILPESGQGLEVEEVERPASNHPQVRLTEAASDTRDSTSKVWRTICNKFRVFRVYEQKPITKVGSLKIDRNPQNPETKEKALKRALLPFKTFSAFLYTKWHLGNSQGTNSQHHSDRFTKEVITDPRWHCPDIEGLDMAATKESLASWKTSPGSPDYAWNQTPITIDLPLGEVPKNSTFSYPASVPFECGTLHHRSIVDIVKSTVANDPHFSTFNWTPFRQYVQRDADVRERVYQDELTGDHAINTATILQEQALASGDTMEWVPLFIKLWSDSMHLTQFGTHSLWPIYMCFANQPTWQRDSSQLGSWHDIAYIPAVRSELLMECIF